MKNLKTIVSQATTFTNEIGYFTVNVDNVNEFKGLLAQPRETTEEHKSAVMQSIHKAGFYNSLAITLGPYGLVIDGNMRALALVSLVAMDGVERTIPYTKTYNEDESGFIEISNITGRNKTGDDMLNIIPLVDNNGRTIKAVAHEQAIRNMVSAIESKNIILGNPKGTEAAAVAYIGYNRSKFQSIYTEALRMINEHVSTQVNAHNTSHLITAMLMGMDKAGSVPEQFIHIGRTNEPDRVAQAKTLIALYV